MSDLRGETLREHPTPPANPLEALRHVLAIYEDAPDEQVVITATTNIYPEEPWTGLRFGDLRRILSDHAHELAEKQRGYAEEEWAGGDARMILRRRVARHLADLIDPKKESNG